MISVVIPVKDGGADLVRCLEAIASTDRRRGGGRRRRLGLHATGAPARARALGARVHAIPPSEFHHGRTRNLGAELARGDMLVFTSQDAYGRATWLARLTASLRPTTRSPACTDASFPTRTRPRPSGTSSTSSTAPSHGCSASRSEEELAFESTLFSNVNSAIPKRVWEAFPFADDIVMSEDQEWSRRVLLAGHAIVYEPAAAVHHSHAYSLASAMRRSRLRCLR